MLREFDSIGRSIQERFDRADRSPAAFSEIAATEFLRARLGRIPASEILRSFAARDADDIEQRSSLSFGEPNITVYAGDGFHLEVLCWFSSTTLVHEHAFCGAFSVLDGGSIHSNYSFVERESIRGELSFGELDLIATERLAPGDVRPIEPWDAFIHSLFHLEKPSISLCARGAAADAEERKARSFYGDVGVVENCYPLQSTDPLDTWWRIAEALRTLEPARRERFLMDRLRVASAAQAFVLLRENPDLRDQGCAQAPALPARLAGEIDEALRATDRQRQFELGRYLLNGRSERLFLAVLRAAELGARNPWDVLEPGEEAPSVVMAGLDAMSRSGWLELDEESRRSIAASVGAQGPPGPEFVCELDAALAGTILEPLGNLIERGS